MYVLVLVLVGGTYMYTMYCTVQYKYVGLIQYVPYVHVYVMCVYRYRVHMYEGNM